MNLELSNLSFTNAQRIYIRPLNRIAINHDNCTSVRKWDLALDYKREFNANFFWFDK